MTTREKGKGKREKVRRSLFHGKIPFLFLLTFYFFPCVEAANRPSKKETYELIGAGDKYAKTGDFVRALPFYQQAVMEDPNYYLGWFNRGMALNAIGRQEDALSDFSQAIDLNPTAVDALAQKGRTLTALGRYEEAVTALDSAIALNPTFLRAWLFKGEALEKLGKLEEAHQAFMGATERNPDYLPAWNSRGRVLTALNRLPEARKCFERALELNKFSIDAYRGLAGTYLAEDNKALALKVYDRGIRAFATNYEGEKEIERLKEALLSSQRKAPMKPQLQEDVTLPTMVVPGVIERLEPATRSSATLEPIAGSTTAVVSPALPASVEESSDTINPDEELKD